MNKKRRQAYIWERSHFNQVPTINKYNYWTFATITLELLLTEFLNIYRKKKTETNQQALLFCILLEAAPSKTQHAYHI